MAAATIEFLNFLWTSFLLLGPMLMLGLLIAGLIHVLISRGAILKWLRHDSLGSVATAAAIGVPMPLCSCSVVPVVAEMRRKGASRSSCMSFLITAPETGADSILVTHAFFGFAAAVARPVVSFVTAVVTGIFCIGLIRDDDDVRQGQGTGDHDQCHDHEHDGHVPLLPDRDDCYVAPAQVMASLRLASADEERLAFKTIVRHVLRYGFVEVADDILFALLVGVALGGLLYLAIPTDLMANEYARWLAYPPWCWLACRCTSARLQARPSRRPWSRRDSALAPRVFLMTGPATNTGTIAIIVSQFGSRFATIYVSVVIGVTVLAGIAIDILLLLAGWSLTVNLDASDSAAIAVLQWGGAFGLIALIAWRFRAGAFTSGYQDLLANLAPMAAPLKAWWLRFTQ